MESRDLYATDRFPLVDQGLGTKTASLRQKKDGHALALDGRSLHHWLLLTPEHSSNISSTEFGYRLGRSVHGKAQARASELVAVVDHVAVTTVIKNKRVLNHL